jgi:hypothetical protein
MWSEELMANNNRLFKWGTSCRRRSRAEVVRSWVVQIEEGHEVQARWILSPLKNVTRKRNEAQYRNSRDGAQKQSRSCRVTTSTATKVSHGEIRLVQQLRNLYLGL